MSYWYFYYPLSDQSIEDLSYLVNSIPQDWLYYSPVIDYIAWNVLENAHVTVFFWILHHKIQKNHLDNFLVDNQDMVQLIPDTLTLQPWYQNLYQVLSLKIKEINLNTLFEKCKTFPYEIGVQYDIFTPHITLAYLTAEYKYDISPMNDINLYTKWLSYWI